MSDQGNYEPFQGQMASSGPRSAPTRRLTEADKALMATHTWSGISKLKLEDHVVVADPRIGALQGIVAFVGKVHFEEGLWVGIQLTGPSLGKGYNDGSVQGKRYFTSVGKRNGLFTHISGIQRRIESPTKKKPKSPEAQLAQMKYIDSLKQDREAMLLKQNDQKKRSQFIKKGSDDIYIQRMKQESQQEIRMSRAEPSDADLFALSGPKVKYGPQVDSKLCDADFEFMKGLQDAKQNFVLTDPTLPDNPVTFASQAFLNVTGYSLNEVIGRNCRFLQGKMTSPRAVAKIRLAIDEGSDCSIRLVNYRKDGTPFWNEFFITSLRDTRGRVKSYVGVQVELTDQVAEMKNEVTTYLETRSNNSAPSPQHPLPSKNPVQSAQQRHPSRSRTPKRRGNAQVQPCPPVKNEEHYRMRRHHSDKEEKCTRSHPPSAKEEKTMRRHHSDKDGMRMRRHHYEQEEKQKQRHPAVKDERYMRRYNPEEMHLRGQPSSQRDPRFMAQQSGPYDQRPVSGSQQQQLHPLAHGSYAPHPRALSSPYVQTDGFLVPPYKCLPGKATKDHHRQRGSEVPARSSKDSYEHSREKGWSKMMNSQHSLSESSNSSTEPDSSLCYSLSDDDSSGDYGRRLPYVLKAKCYEIVPGMKVTQLEVG